MEKHFIPEYGAVHHGQPTNHILMNIEDYDNENEFWSQVGDLMRILTNNNYQCVFRYEDVGIYAIDYEYCNESSGGCMPVWLDTELHTVIDYHIIDNDNSES